MASTKRFIPAILIVLLLLCTGCAKNSIGATESSSASTISPVLPGGQPADKESAGKLPDISTAESAKNNSLYDPSIFVIQAEGTWRQELAPGYYTDYECELYIYKADANDSRSASGLYTGVFWMKTTLDTEGYLKELLKDVPVEMDFKAGGEGICDNLTVHLLDGFERDAFEDYAIPDGQGEPLTPVQDMLADRGGFITVGKEVYLETRARGAQGEKLEHQGSQTGEEEINYVMHVEPDPEKTKTERKVTIYLSNAQGMSVTLDGVWCRLPGYPEDMLEYVNSGKTREVLDKHLK